MSLSLPADDAGQPGRRERKRQQTADHLADTAWTLFQSHGFDAVTMEAIAAAADVAKGTLYKHFPVKEALLRHRFHRELAEALPALLGELSALPTVTERLQGFFRHSAEWSLAHRDYLKEYVRYRLSEVGTPAEQEPGRHSGLDGLFASFIAAGQASGEYRRGTHPAVLARYLQFLHLAALLRWLHEPTLDLQAEFGTVLDVFLHGIV